ncbi:unnamed protein product [Mytilus edulis]|uniref:Uncharacterized protein n=1 Tax=Mytilus edulis TaxID=6550 RepID=A0A8S3S5G8_MYTED|nr:unnamed protein product [Mytilus edulis]
MLYSISENKTASAETFTQAQTPVKSNLPVSVTLRKQLNVKQSKHEYKVIYGCIKIDNALVLTELNKTRLIICNADSTDIHHFPLPKNPNYITKIDSITVAVSCYELSIQDTTILIVNISTGSVISRFSTCGDCRGISYNDDNMYVVIRSMIKVMDLTGKVKRSIPLPLDDIRDISVNGDRLVCIKYTSVYCCSLDGKLIWEFENYDLQDLRRVTTDAEGMCMQLMGRQTL